MLCQKMQNTDWDAFEVRRVGRWRVVMVASSVARHGSAEGGTECVPAQRFAGAGGDGMHNYGMHVRHGWRLEGCAVSWDVETEFLIKHDA